MAVWTNRSVWYAAAAGSLVAAIAVGVALDAEGFAENLLAEVVGVVVSVLLAVSVVERLLESDRRARWRLVSEQTTRTLRSALVKASLPIYLALPSPKRHGADPRTAEDAGVLADGLVELEKGLRASGENERVGGPKLEDVLQETRPHLQLVFRDVMPRLLALGSNPELIQRLMAVETALQALDHRLWSVTSMAGGIIGPGHLTHREAADELAGLVETFGAVVRYLDADAAAAGY